MQRRLRASRVFRLGCQGPSYDASHVGPNEWKRTLEEEQEESDCQARQESEHRPARQPTSKTKEGTPANRVTGWCSEGRRLAE